MDPSRSLKVSQRGGHATTSGAPNSEVELRERISFLEQDLVATKHKFRQFRESTISALRTLAQRQKVGFDTTSVDQQTQVTLVEEDDNEEEDEDEEEEEEEKEEEKKSRPRRITRTRTGCTNCRLRRKKCGEERPTCNACRRLGIECEYSAKYQLPKSAERNAGAVGNAEAEQLSSYGEFSGIPTAFPREDQSFRPLDTAAHQKNSVIPSVGQTWHQSPALYTLPVGNTYPHPSHAAPNDRFPHDDTIHDRKLSLFLTEHASCAPAVQHTNDATQVGSSSQPLNGETYACAKCDYEAKSKYHLERHQTKHTDEKPFKCRKCSKSYKRKDSLDTHQKSCSWAIPQRQADVGCGVVLVWNSSQS